MCTHTPPPASLATPVSPATPRHPRHPRPVPAPPAPRPPATSRHLPQEMELVALLPARYVMSTTLHDRLVHLQLLKRLRAAELQVLSTWTQYTDRVGTGASAST